MYALVVQLYLLFFLLCLTLMVSGGKVAVSQFGACLNMDDLVSSCLLLQVLSHQAGMPTSKQQVAPFNRQTKKKETFSTFSPSCSFLPFVRKLYRAVSFSDEGPQGAFLTPTPPPSSSLSPPFFFPPQNNLSGLSG